MTWPRTRFVRRVAGYFTVTGTQCSAFLDALKSDRFA